jgi:hypothetical protein
MLLGFLVTVTGCVSDGLMDYLPSFIAGSALGTTVLSPIAEVIGNVIGDIQSIVDDADFNVSTYTIEPDTFYAQGGSPVSGFG